MEFHLYEIVLESPVMWVKSQASCESHWQANAMLEARFGGTTNASPGPGYLPQSFSMPIRLSECGEWVMNWNSIEHQLPDGWDDHEFRLVQGPYSWCESLSDGCVCYGTRGRLDATYVSDFGLHDEEGRRNRKSQNARAVHHNKEAEESFARQDESARERARKRHEEYLEERRTTRRTTSPDRIKYVSDMGLRNLDEVSGEVASKVNGLTARGFYCQIDRKYHPYDGQAKQQLMFKALALVASLSEKSQQERGPMIVAMDGILGLWLQRLQNAVCAERRVQGKADIPDVLYKYVPKDRIGNGAPNSLRATQILALNDDMECNLETRNDIGRMGTLDFLALAQSKLEQHLGVSLPWEEVLDRRTSYGDLRLTTFVQQYLNPRVGVVSFTTDILVPTMWAHYARNTGIVVGYETEALLELGFEIGSVSYSEFAPMYEPAKDDVIRLCLVDHDIMEQDARAGKEREGFPVLCYTDLTQFCSDWKTLSRLLFVKGTSWSHEKEVRLLVDLEQTRDIGKQDANGWPVKVIDPPPEAIREIHAGANTNKADVERAIEVGRGDNKKGLLEGQLSSHAFRIQRTVGSYH